MAIAKAMEARTMPEIINIEILPRIIGRGVCGVLAIVTTNISSFSGIASYESSLPPGTDILRDFTVIQEKARDVFRNVDPRDLNNVDQIIGTISGMDTSISMALSIACCRAGARHKDMPLYR